MYARLVTDMKPANRLPAAAAGITAPTRLKVLMRNKDTAVAKTALLRHRNPRRTVPVPRNGSVRPSPAVIALNHGSSSAYCVRLRTALATM